MSDDLTGASFGKITCFDSPVPVATIAEQVGLEVGALPSSIPDMGDSAGELSLFRIHKTLGIQTVIDHLRIGREQVVAIGDASTTWRCTNPVRAWPLAHSMGWLSDPPIRESVSDVSPRRLS